MTVSDQDFSMYAGDDQIIRITVTDDSGDPLNITGASIEWVMRYNGSIVLTKSTASGISITDAEDGVFDVTLLPADTYALEPKVYDHGACLSVIAGTYYTVATGLMTLLPKVRS